MTYSPECVAEFEAKFPPKNGHIEIFYDPSLQRYTGMLGDYAAIAKQNGRLEAFAANWERMRELEQTLKHLADEADYLVSTGGLGDKTDIQREVQDARKLLEKGNE